MKRFAAETTIFVIPLFFLLYALDIFISSRVRKSASDLAGEIEVWNDIYSGSLAADIAIYGSSRAWVHINPKIFEDSLDFNVYNFGIDGHNFSIQFLRHLEYIRQNPTPKIIILSIDVFTLEKRSNLYNLDQFLPYMLWNHNINRFTRTFEGFSDFDYFVPFVRYSDSRNSIKKTFKSKLSVNTKLRYKGFRGYEMAWNEDLSKAKKETAEYIFKPDEPTQELFEQFINECRENNIELILVYSPEYIEGQKFVTNRDEMINLFKHFSKKHNLLFLDYSGDDIGKEKKYFYNSQHLNSTGADLFTKILICDLKRSIKLLK
jgi:hypothetical protein